MTVSKIRVRLPTKFPSSVSASSPIVLSKTGGAFAFSLDAVALEAILAAIYQPLNSVLGTPNEITATIGTGTITMSLPAALTFTGKTVTGGTFTGGTFASGVSYNKVVITAPATSATLTLIDGTTLTGPAASGTVMTLGNVETVTGAKTFGSAGAVGKLKVAGTTSGSTIIDATAVASGTLTLPAATDTLMGKATTDTMTNKTFDSAGTGNALSVSGVAVSRGQFPGANSNTAATAGNIGEPKSQTILAGSAVSLTNTTPANIATITLTAGNWLLWAQPAFTGGATTTATGLRSSISTTSATENTASPNFAGSSYSGSFTPFATLDVAFAIAPIIVSLSGSQQYWLVSRANFATSTCSGYGGLFATRLP